MTKITKKAVTFAAIFIILIVTPVFLNQYYNYLLSPVSPNSTDVQKIFVVTPGQPLGTIAANLKKQNLIKNPLAFRLYVAQIGIEKSIQAGDFKISPSESSKQIAQDLTHGAIDIWVTLPEGLRLEEQAAKIEEKLKFGQNANYMFDKKEYIKTASEGYMFPDTYLIPKDATAKFVADQLKNTFDEKVGDMLKNSKSKMSVDDIVILASLLEKEAKTSQEKPTIAGIITNRLNIGMALQVDAAVAYAKGYDTAQNTWWPQITTDDYKSVKSPYNTYLSPGLPPGPINSPGIDSIKAALSPEDTDYMYYLHDAKGQIHYAKTAQEHNQNIKNFL